MIRRAYLCLERFESAVNRALSPLTHALCVTLLLGSTTCAAQEVFDFSPQRQTGSQPGSTSASTQAVTNFPTLPLLKQYRGEETRGVRYLDASKRARAKVSVQGGALVDVERRPLNPTRQISVKQPLATFPEQPPTAEVFKLGFAIYVMNASGERFVSFEAEPHRFHHSSLAGGEPVAAAGEMIIFQGKLYAINNRSGHYRPPPITLDRVVKTLKRRGVSFEGVLVKRYGSDF